MSAGSYQLLSSDSPESDDYEPSNGRPVFLSKKASTSSNFLVRIAASAISIISNTFNSARGRHRRRKSGAFNINNVSIASIAYSARSYVSSLRRRTIFGLFIIALIIFFGSNWDKFQTFYEEQILMVTPGPACLGDPASASSYVHWDPAKKSYGSIYHCIRQPAPSPSINRAQPGSSLRTYRPLPDKCIENYYATGSTCNDGERTKFDIIWTWVNGSDPLIHRSRAKAMARIQRGDQDDGEEDDDDYEETAEQKKANAHLYNEHDELRHSMRSVLENFRDSATRFTIFTSDFDFPDTYSPIKYLLGLAKRSIPGMDESASNVAKAKRSMAGGEPRSAEKQKREPKKVKSQNKKISQKFGAKISKTEDLFEEQMEEDEFANARLGLLPQWLKHVRVKENGKANAAKWKDGDITLEVKHHAEIYEEYDGTVFNSNSIESQLFRIAGDREFIYFNDDCFFHAPISSADFHSPNYGLVFRLIAYPFYLVNPHHYSTASPIGEWGPMEFTNWVVSQRFGYRRRPYTLHQVKVLQGSLMREMWEMWPDQGSINRGHKFRGMGGLHPVVGNRTWANDVDPLEAPPKPRVEDEDKDGEKKSKRDLTEKAELTVMDEDDEEEPAPKPKHLNPGVIDDGDVHVIFLFTHFIIERHREAMIWSWIVATIGGDHDEFGTAQRKEAWRILKEDAQAIEFEDKKLEVNVIKRKTMEPWRVQWALDEFGDTLKASQYRFSSQDGYAYSFYDEHKGLEWWHNESTDWPLLFEDYNFPEKVEERRIWANCTIAWDVCFPEKINTASEVFRHVSFREPKCGDCILKGLVRASGDLGLSALMPPADRVYPPLRSTKAKSAPPPLPTSSAAIPPHLPLHNTWDAPNADFSLAAVFASGFWTSPDGSRRVSLRNWVQRMLERYRYVLADTPNNFAVIHDPGEAERTFKFLDEHKKVALFTMNDDMNRGFKEADEKIRTWLEQRWPTPAAWERHLPSRS